MELSKCLSLETIKELAMLLLTYLCSSIIDGLYNPVS